MALVIIGGVVACIIGWHVSRVHMSHRGIPIRKGQLREYRRQRVHHSIWFLVIGTVLVLILIAADHVVH
jgi:hypothetical protein